MYIYSNYIVGPGHSRVASMMVSWELFTKYQHCMDYTVLARALSRNYYIFLRYVFLANTFSFKKVLILSTYFFISSVSFSSCKTKKEFQNIHFLSPGFQERNYPQFVQEEWVRGWIRKWERRICICSKKWTLIQDYSLYIVFVTQNAAQNLNTLYPMLLMSGLELSYMILTSVH